MIRIADTHIPVAKGQGVAAVTSNAIYLLCAVGLAAAYGWGALVVAIPLGVLATGSSLFHATAEKRWAQLMDGISIQMVMAGLLVLSLLASTKIPLWAAAIPLPAVWLAQWLWGHWLPRNMLIVAQGIPVLLVLWYEAGTWQAGTAAVLIGAALALQRMSSTHSLKHALWHLLSAAAITLSASWLITV